MDSTSPKKSGSDGNSIRKKRRIVRVPRELPTYKATHVPVQIRGSCEIGAPRSHV